MNPTWRRGGGPAWRGALAAAWLAALACSPGVRLRDGGAAAADRRDPVEAGAALDTASGDDGAGLDRSATDHPGVELGTSDRAPLADATSGGGIDPSGGSGGTLAPGATGNWSVAAGSGQVRVRLPSSYAGAAQAAPVIWLFNEALSSWQALADDEGLVLVDLDEYNDISAYVAKLNAVAPQLEASYNVDRARYHLAGWSAGGNLVVMLGAQNQDFAVSTLVFPGTGGQDAYSDLAAHSGHRIRLYYACGDQDPSYDWAVVQNEASVFAGLGYTTRFDRVAGSGHFIDEAVHPVRRAAWTWVRDFNLQN